MSMSDNTKELMAGIFEQTFKLYPSDEVLLVFVGAALNQDPGFVGKLATFMRELEKEEAYDKGEDIGVAEQTLNALVAPSGPIPVFCALIKTLIQRDFTPTEIVQCYAEGFKAAYRVP